MAVKVIRGFESHPAALRAETAWLSRFMCGWQETSSRQFRPLKSAEIRWLYTWGAQWGRNVSGAATGDPGRPDATETLPSARRR
jgi:hypothetical protein